jgi:hypothetical protein
MNICRVVTEHSAPPSVSAGIALRAYRNFHFPKEQGDP